MDQLAGQGKRVWFVEDNNVGEKYPEKLNWMKEHGHLLKVDDVHVRARNFIMRVYLFDPANSNLQLRPEAP
jgi:hypothetical protein